MKENFFPLLVGLLVVSTISSGLEENDNHNALWRILNQCQSNRKAGNGITPCIELGQDYAVLQDRKCFHHFLLLPTLRVSGIEDPALLKPKATNYFEDAWKTGPGEIQKRLKKTLPRDGIGFAINSADKRSQEQLHIHMDCINPSVKAELKKRAAEIGKHWTSIKLKGTDYRTRRVDGESLGANPFALLADDLGAKNQQEMRHHSLAAIGATFSDGKKGFYVLDSSTTNGGGHAEDLLDGRCGDCSEVAGGKR